MRHGPRRQLFRQLAIAGMPHYYNADIFHFFVSSFRDISFYFFHIFSLLISFGFDFDFQFSRPLSFRHFDVTDTLYAPSLLPFHVS